MFLSFLHVLLLFLHLHDSLLGFMLILRVRLTQLPVYSLQHSLPLHELSDARLLPTDLHLILHLFPTHQVVQVLQVEGCLLELVLVVLDESLPLAVLIAELLFGLEVVVLHVVILLDLPNQPRPLFLISRLG